MQEPSFFRDLNMDQYALFFKDFEVGAELIPYFYYLSKSKEETEHRQSVMKDLCDHDIRAAVNRFISGIGVAERYLGYSEIVNASVAAGILIYNVLDFNYNKGYYFTNRSAANSTK